MEINGWTQASIGNHGRTLEGKIVTAYNIGNISGNIEVATRVATWVAAAAASAAIKVAT